MIEPIEDIDPATGLSRGAFVVGPDGQVVTLARGAVIKDGWDYATQGDLDAVSESAIEVDDSPVIAVVESISIDAPIYDPRDRD